MITLNNITLIKNYHYQFDRSKTYLCIVLQIDICKRTMLSRTAIKSHNALNNKLAPHDAEQIARSALSFSKMITDPEMVANLGASSKTVTANTFVTTKVHDYITDNTMIGGTSTIKTNFVAAFVNQNKQMVYPYTHIAPLVDNTKIIFHPSLFTSKGASVRTLVELPLISAFAERFPQIKKVTILGDNISIPGRTQNTNRDLLVGFQNGNTKDFDIKTKRLTDDDVLHGHIREISVSNHDIVTYPRDYSLVAEQYPIIINKLKRLMLLDNIKKTMSYHDIAQIDFECNNIQKYLISGKTLAGYHQQVENSLMNINQLQSYPSNVNFYNIYHIKNGELTAKEMTFLQEAIKMADASILDKPSYMQKYLVDCLHVFHQHVNGQTYNTLKPLIKVYPFIKQLLINYVGPDV